MRQIAQYIRSNRGQTMVELALVLPVFILLLTAIIDFSFVFHQYTVLTEAAREGARSAALGNSNAAVITTVKAAVPDGSIDTNMLTVTVSTADRTSGNPVTVTATYPLQTLTHLSDVFFSQTTVQGSATMRVE